MSDELNPQSELEWQAFLYVSNEMSAEEAVAFENRLAEEQAAREAVVAAVELTARVAATKPVAQPIPARQAQSLRQTRMRAFMVALVLLVAASAAILLGPWGAGDGKNGSNSVVSGDGSSQARSLLELWNKPDGATDELLGDNDDSIAGDDLTVPGWMFTALAPKKASPEEPDEMMED